MTRLWLTWQRVQGWTIEHAQRVLSASDRGKDDRGESILVLVVITGLLVAAAIIIVGIIVTKATNAANNIQTQ